MVAQPLHERRVIGLPRTGPHLGPGPVLCHSTYSSRSSFKRSILIHISDEETKARWVLFLTVCAGPVYIIMIDILSTCSVPGTFLDASHTLVHLVFIEAGI